MSEPGTRLIRTHSRIDSVSKHVSQANGIRVCERCKGDTLGKAHASSRRPGKTGSGLGTAAARGAREDGVLGWRSARQRFGDAGQCVCLCVPLGRQSYAQRRPMVDIRFGKAADINLETDRWAG